MSVEFTICTADLRRALDQLKANRGKRKDTDSVDNLVSECAATFRAVGTETEEPVNGKHPGSVRAPLKTMDAISKILNTFKKKQLTLRCDPGVIKVESFSVKHPDIELGRIPDQRLALPVDISALDVLALAEILTAEQVIEEGLRARVGEAVDARRVAISNALPSLEIFGVRERHLQNLINGRVKEAAIRLRQSLLIG